MSPTIETSKVWSDSRGMGRTLRAVVGGPPPEAAADLVRSARRVVATGNGAALYAALVLESATRTTTAEAPPLVCVPAGLLLGGQLAWRDGDLPLVVSASGELRDVVTLLDEGRLPDPRVVLTATPTSTLGRAATERVDVSVPAQEAVTHTQAYVGNVVAGLRLWDTVIGGGLDVEWSTLADRLDQAVAASPEWAREAADLVDGRESGIALAAGAGWPTALETALVLKEVAGLAVEGLEAREAATSGMYALTGRSVVVAAALDDDPLAAEAAKVCAATGAVVLELPSGRGCRPLELPVLAFPAALALAVELGLRRGRDVDTPAWVDAYYRTARTSAAPAKPPEGESP